MVDGREGAVEPANLASSARETFKCLRRGHFVHNVPVHSARDQLPRDAVTEWTVVTTDLSMYMMVVPSSATWTTWLSNTYMHSARTSAPDLHRLRARSPRRSQGPEESETGPHLVVQSSRASLWAGPCVSECGLQPYWKGLTMLLGVL